MTGEERLWGIEHPTAEQVEPAGPVRTALRTGVLYLVFAALVIGAAAAVGLLLFATFVDISGS